MHSDFVLPSGSVGRFAVVKLWPGIQTAEDECIARLKLAAKAIGSECVEILADGSLIGSPEIKVSKTNVDFVLHLHYDTPKRYDAFSIVALWNPLKFYHEWGYRRCSRNLTTHDDFISCSSDAADHHVARMILRSKSHLPALFKLYHSTPSVTHAPSLGDGKLFYAGINWEAIVSSRKSRQQEVLKRMDKTGLLRIYGPTVFQGVRVWADYESYVKEIPFDGFSMIDEISKAGAALVLSSQAHKDSELMSNRLFETIAAGTLVICDENPFAKRFFGDTLLYIDGRSSIEQIYDDITRHLAWANANPELALEKIAKAQAIFRDGFSLIQNLSDLYSGLAERKRELATRQNPDASAGLSIKLHLLMPEFSEKVLEQHIHSVEVQDYKNLEPVLVIDRCSSESNRVAINSAIAASKVEIQVKEVDWFNYGVHPEIKAKRKLGGILVELLDSSTAADAFIVVAPNESLISNHLSVLAGALEREQEVSCAATAAVLLDGDQAVHTVHELIDFGHVNRDGPPGYGRFIIRMSTIGENYKCALPYMDGRPMAILVGENTVSQQMPATIFIDIQREFPERVWDDAVENQIIQDYSPGAFKISGGFTPIIHHHSQVSTAAPNLNFFKLFTNRRWIKSQIQAIRTQGLSARLMVFKRKVGL